jgi:hypothetical protein
MPVQTAKVMLALVGVALFFLGAKLAMPALRWGAIVLVAVAFLLRFYRPRSR